MFTNPNLGLFLWLVDAFVPCHEVITKKSWNFWRRVPIVLRGVSNSRAPKERLADIRNRKEMVPNPNVGLFLWFVKLCTFYLFGRSWKSPPPPINIGALTDTPDGPRGITSYINPSVYQKELTNPTNRARLLPSSRTIASKFCVVLEYKEWDNNLPMHKL